MLRRCRERLLHRWEGAARHERITASSPMAGVAIGHHWLLLPGPLGAEPLNIHDRSGHVNDFTQKTCCAAEGPGLRSRADPATYAPEPLPHGPSGWFCGRHAE